MTHGLILLRKTSVRKKRQMLEFSKCQAMELFFWSRCVCLYLREIWKHYPGEGMVKVKRRKKAKRTAN